MTVAVELSSLALALLCGLLAFAHRRTFHGRPFARSVPAALVAGMALAAPAVASLSGAAQPPVWLVPLLLPVQSAIAAAVWGLARPCEPGAAEAPPHSPIAGSELLRSAFEQLPIEFWLCDRDGRYVMQNAEAQRLWGNWIGKRTRDLDLPPDVRRIWDEQDRRAFGGETVAEEVSYEHGDERLHYLETIVPLRDADGEITGLLGVALDVTERKLAQQRLEQAEARMRTAIEHLPVELWASDAEGRVVLQNPISVTLWGPLIGKRVEEMEHLPERIREAWLENERQVLAGEVRRHEVRYPVGGEMRDFQQTVAPMRVDGEVVGYVGINSDITDIKRVQDAHREAEDRFRDFAAIAADWFWELDAQLRFAYVSGGYAGAGRASPDLIGRRYQDVYAERAAADPAWRAHLTDLEEHLTYVFEYTSEAADGGLRHTRSVGRALFDAAGTFLGYRGAGHDVTQRRRYEQAQQRLLDENRRLAQTLINSQEAERRRLARELHDELGQALTAIQVDAESINLLADDRPGIRASALAIRDASSQVYEVVHSMMGRLRPPALDDLGLNDALLGLVNEWRARHAGIGVTFTLDEGLQGLADDIALAVYRIVQECLTNISKHAGATEVTVEVRRDDEGRELRVRVSDDGRGIRLGSGPGGLGLIGMRERVQALRGELDIDTVEPRGTLIEARLPLRG